jgi:glycerol uptake facilitator-like aquaporin
MFQMALGQVIGQIIGQVVTFSYIYNKSQGEVQTTQKNKEQHHN